MSEFSSQKHIAELLLKILCTFVLHCQSICMKNLLSSLFLITPALIFGQISINNSTFPDAGTVLKYFSRQNSGGISVGTAGENKVWNYNNLTGGQPIVEKYLTPSNGVFKDSFPDANILITNSAQEDGEQYGRILNSRIEIVGFAGENPILGGDIAIKYSKRPQLRRSPMFYETTSYSESSFNLAFSSAVIPDTLLSLFPIKPDSLRITFSSVKSDTIDAWGKLNLLNQSFDVLREKSVLQTTNKLEIKVPFLGWLDVSTLIGNNIPGGGNLPGFGRDTSIIFNYYTNTKKDVLVSITTNNRGQIEQVDYADINNTINTFDYNLNQNNLVYPNPVNDLLIFKNDQLLAGNYTATLLNAEGKVVRTLQISKYDTEVLTFDVQTLPNGAYTLVLTTEKGVQNIRAPFIVQH